MTTRRIAAGFLAFVLSAGVAGFAFAQSDAGQKAPVANPASSAPATNTAGRNNDAAAVSPSVAADTPTPRQPGNNAPVWRAVRSGDAGYASIPGREVGVLIQSRGEAWRKLRNGPVTWLGGAFVLLVVAALAVFYLFRGPIKLSEPRTGRRILRFRSIERMAHWTTAISFVVLGLTGLLMLFGKHVLMPVMGHTLHGYLVVLGKNVHNFVGPIFSAALLVVIALFIRDNVPDRSDWEWLKKGGGLFGGGHVPAGKFNAMQKGLFWAGVVGLGAIVTATGYVLDFPNFDQLRATMQTMNVIHAIAAVAMVGMMLGHIYIGTIGMEGAYEAMRTGYVDESWAREHHEDWYREVKDRPQTEDAPDVVRPLRPAA